MQFEIGTSTRRYLPPSGTAGFERCAVSGNKRVPAPPPRITASMLRFRAIGTLENRRKGDWVQGNGIPTDLLTGRALHRKSPTSSQEHYQGLKVSLDSCGFVRFRVVSWIVCL